jgi:outer membrane protein assembly factor BamE (lipoprotein component of BamABCDE complex)
MIIVLVVGLFFSCATTYKIGKPYSTDHVAKIIIGKTSATDVRSLFGDPWKTGIFNGNVVYSYCYEEYVFHRDDSVEKNGNTLIIEFDENKIVVNFYFNIPGKGPNVLGLMMHENYKMKQQEEQAARQNQMATNLDK